MLASSLSRVMPALCTTMSSRPCRCSACSSERAPASGAVTSSCSAVPRTRLATATSCSPAAGTSTAMTVAPSRARVSAIEAPMPRAAPVTTATRPASGFSQSSGQRAGGGVDGQQLTVDERGLGRQEEPQRAEHRGGRDRHAVVEHDAVAGGPAAQLLGQRPQQTVDALPRGGDRRGVVGTRGARDGDHAGAAGQRLEHRAGGQHRLRQLVGVRQLGEREDHRGVPGAGRGVPVHVEVPVVRQDTGRAPRTRARDRAPARPRRPAAARARSAAGARAAGARAACAIFLVNPLLTRLR